MNGQLYTREDAFALELHMSVRYWPSPHDPDVTVFGPQYAQQRSPLASYPWDEQWHRCTVHKDMSWRGSGGCFACAPSVTAVTG